MKFKLVQFCSTIVTLAFAAYQIQGKVDISEIQSQLPNAIQSASADSGIDLSKIPNYDNLQTAMSNFSAEDATKLLKEKCRNTTGSDEAYDEITTGTQKFSECIQELFNVTQIQTEMEEAKPKGELDSVFNKYCKKRYTALDCLDEFTSKLDRCLTVDEQAQKTNVVNIFSNLLKFVCNKDGDQITLFIAEKGPECFTSQKNELIDCMNDTLRPYVMSQTGIPAIGEFKFTEKHCNDFSKLRKCMVTILEQCEESTPANIVDALFKFVRKETPCYNMTLQATTKKNGCTATSAISITILSISVLFGLFTALLT